MNRTQEFAAKHQRLLELIDRLGLAGVLLRRRDNFSWITGGGQNYVNVAQERGVGAVLVTADETCLVADNIEADRLIEEELDGLAMGKVDYPWHEPTAQMRAVRQIVGEGTLGVDCGEGDRLITADLAAQRNPLTPAEVERYAAHGRQTTRITEGVCRQIQPGMSEDDVVAMLHERFARVGVRVPVYLVAADDRIDRRRHPITTGRTINKRVMVVVCAESAGLWINLTRLVNFEPLDGELKIKHRATCQVDASANTATRPGRRLSDIFADIMAEYARQGFADQWTLHHQGGSTGYNGRDAFATPACEAIVVENQAFAWNPSITGTKSEDTVLIEPRGLRWLTEPGEGWPVVEIEHDGVAMRRADILLL